MKKIRLLPILIWVLFLQTFNVSAQNVDFNLRYNGISDAYEVYAKPDSTNPTFFVGGGSQISILLPEAIANTPLLRFREVAVRLALEYLKMEVTLIRVPLE